MGTYSVNGNPKITCRCGKPWKSTICNRRVSLHWLWSSFPSYYFYTKYIWINHTLLIYLLNFRYDGSNDLASGECYNPQSNTWANITPMGTKRSCLGKFCLIDFMQYFYSSLYILSSLIVMFSKLSFYCSSKRNNIIRWLDLLLWRIWWCIMP